MGLSQNGTSLIQAVAYNFDANISSQNGLVYPGPCNVDDPSEPQEQTDEPEQETITCLTKSEINEDILPGIPVQWYCGPQKPDMPPEKSTQSPLPLKILVCQQIAVQRAQC